MIYYNIPICSRCSRSCYIVAMNLQNTVNGPTIFFLSFSFCSSAPVFHADTSHFDLIHHFMNHDQGKSCLWAFTTDKKHWISRMACHLSVIIACYNVIRQLSACTYGSGIGAVKILTLLMRSIVISCLLFTVAFW